MIQWLLKLIPVEWRWQVAIKRVAWMAGKLLAALVAYANAQTPGFLEQIGVSLDPETFEAGMALFVAGSLELVHDWLRLRFPDVRYF